MAATHTHADKKIANRFIDHVTLSSLSILILVSPAMIDTCLRACTCENSRCGLTTYKAHGHRLYAVDNNRPQSDQNEKGTNGAGSVMNTAG
jgi:hypothetical protein